MALLRSLLSNSRCRRSSDFTKVTRVFSYCTEAPGTTSQASASTSRGYLYNRISPLGNQRDSLFLVLDQWLKEGQRIEHPELSGTIKQLRVFKRYNQALEVSEWMSKHLELSPQDAAVRLDLISNVRGLKEAEKYFDGLPSSLRDLKVYGALLNCYVRGKFTEKAEATMQKMKELGYFTTTLSYNVMLKLYSETKQYEKLEALVQEMEGKGIVGDKHTLSHQLKAYAAKSDIEGMEKILGKIKADPVISVDWNVYAGACNGYLIAGLKDKALEMIKDSEKFVKAKSSKFAYEVLMTLYAKLENKDEVYRLWNLCKKTGKVYNKTYISVLSSLYKLDDLEGMEKIYEEWEAEMISFDIRIPHLLIVGYCKKGLMEKAESIVEQLAESENKPTADTWDRIASGYCKNSQFEKAVEAMKKATLVSQPKWKPNVSTLVACTEYLKEKEDEDFAMFKSLLDKHSHLSTNVSKTLDVGKENELPSE